MIHGYNISDPVDLNEVKDYTNDLIKEHRMKGKDPKNHIGYSLNKEEGLQSAKITAKRLAEITGKKFYYEVINYINQLLNES